MTPSPLKTYLVTGCFGFIGHHLCEKLINQGNLVIGIDNLCKDESSDFKELRKEAIAKNKSRNFIFFHADIRDKEILKAIFEQYRFDAIYHLAAKTGVRDSTTNYEEYFTTNIIGTCNIIDCNKDQKALLLMASSSSVYGDNKQVPFHEKQEINTPISLYAVSKASSELVAYNYAKNFDMPLICLRFFTVYGPYSRPDMAVFLFMDAIQNQKPFTLYNEGEMHRDFTYVGDIVESLDRLSNAYQMDEMKAKLVEKQSPEVFNIGFGDSRKVKDMIALIEHALDKKAMYKSKDKMKEDMSITYSDSKKLHHFTKFSPQINLEEGIQKTVEWYKEWSELKMIHLSKDITYSQK